MTRTRTPDQTRAWADSTDRNRNSIEDLDQNHTCTRPNLAAALELARAAAAVLDRRTWITAGAPLPGLALAWSVTAYETADPIARIMPDGMTTTRPDGRPEYLPACPVGSSNPQPLGRINYHTNGAHP